MKPISGHCYEGGAFLTLDVPEFQASTYRTRQYPIDRAKGGAAGVSTTHIYAILGCGEPGIFVLARHFPERRFGVKVNETNFTCAGVALPQTEDFSVVAP